MLGSIVGFAVYGTLNISRVLHLMDTPIVSVRPQFFIMSLLHCCRISGCSRLGVLGFRVQGLGFRAPHKCYRHPPCIASLSHTGFKSGLLFMIRCVLAEKLVASRNWGFLSWSNYL